METYVDVLAGIGALIPLTAWLPMVLRAFAVPGHLLCRYRRTAADHAKPC
jgi:hypothetical protein